MPGRVVAATSVKGRSAYLSVRAWRPLSMTKLTEKSSMAGYRSSSTARGSRWTSSMNRTSFSARFRSEEHTSELQSRSDLVCRLLLEKKKKDKNELVQYKW